MGCDHNCGDCEHKHGCQDGGCGHDCGSCGHKGTCSKQDLMLKPHDGTKIKKVIAVVSGKGGVGKSLVTSLLAVVMNRKGFKTGILDADITGPSIPKAFGVKEQIMGEDNTIYPVTSKAGIKMISVNLMLKSETDPVLWRGPVIAGMVGQFYKDVAWGDLDFLFVDMPPGTGDVPLTVFQSLPVAGTVIVTAPQKLVSMIVEKAVKMAEMMNIPVLALVENMSYFECPHCKERYDIFGKSNVDELAYRCDIGTTAKLPVDPRLAAQCDNGRIEDFAGTWLDGLADELAALLG